MKANELNANSLMVGDWVRHINGTPYQVTCIKDGHFACGIPHLWEYNNKFVPIPLTAEILEKNGFIRQQLGNFRYENEDNDLVMAFYPKERNYTEGGYDYIDIHKGRMTLREMPISYVHELQHILKDCRIDKEIVL